MSAQTNPLTGLNPVLAHSQQGDVRQTCSGVDYWPSYEGVMQETPGPAAPPYRSRDGGAYYNGNWYNNSGYCYQAMAPPQVFPRNWVTSAGVPLASAGGRCMIGGKYANVAACQLSAHGGWWPSPMNGGLFIRPNNGLMPPSSWVFSNVAPWGLKQR